MHLGILIALIVGLFCLAALAPAFADIANRGIPGPQDAALALQASVTKTADFNGAGLDLGEGFAPGGIGVPMAAVIDVTALDVADTNETYAFYLEESADNASFAACGVAANVTAVGVAVAKGIVTQRYVRLVLDVGGTTPSVTYSAYLNPNV